jgi:RNA polymerase sporulation-specific sigma factor
MAEMWKRTLAFLRYFLVRVLVRSKAYRYIYYVGSTEVLPPPLTADEEGHLIRRLESGDLTVKSSLIEHNLRLVVYIAKKFENTGINIEDLVSIGPIGLIKAVNTFDPQKNIKLATYASRIGGSYPRQ